MSDLDPVIARTNPLVHEAEALLSIARASELQVAMVANLDKALARLVREKRRAVKARNQDRANLILGFECVLACLQAELKMWLLLKDEDPDGAWTYLIDGQESAAAATRAHPGFRHVEHHLGRLEAIEQLVFPPQVFVSSGFLVGRQICSICRTDYEDCAHVAGRPYWGRFCTIVQQDIRLDHVAIVEHPADKRCRVRNFSTEGGKCNRMTWRVAPDDGVIDALTIATELSEAGGQRSLDAGAADPLIAEIDASLPADRRRRHA